MEDLSDMGYHRTFKELYNDNRVQDAIFFAHTGREREEQSDLYRRPESKVQRSTFVD